MTKPRTIYKYRSINPSRLVSNNKSYYDLACETIDTHKHWFPTVSKLNDLFEFSPYINIDVNHELISSSYTTLLESLKSETNIPDAISEYAATEFKNTLVGGIISIRDWLIDSMKNVGVCSFSRNINSPKMWGIYADSGNGIALEYEVPNKHKGVWNVKYSKERPELSTIDILRSIVSPSKRPNHHRKFICSKSDEWKHEKEVRILSHIGDTYDDPELELKRVILGPRANEYQSSFAKRYRKHYDIVSTSLDSKRYIVNIGEA